MLENSCANRSECVVLELHLIFGVNLVLSLQNIDQIRFWRLTFKSLRLCPRTMNLSQINHSIYLTIRISIGNNMWQLCVFSTHGKKWGLISHVRVQLLKTKLCFIFIKILTRWTRGFIWENSVDQGLVLKCFNSQGLKLDFATIWGLKMELTLRCLEVSYCTVFVID